MRTPSPYSQMTSLLFTNHKVFTYHTVLFSRDLLFDRVWEGLYSDPGARAIYLQSLETVILEGKLLNIPPEIMQQLVKQLEQMDKWQVKMFCGNLGE